MLYTAIIVLEIFSFIISFGDVVTYTEIGVIEERDSDDNTSGSDSSYQEAVLRRRLMPGGLSDADKLTILKVQNNYRNITAQGLTPNQPSATNMNQLLWDAGLAKVAQNYSSACIWGHNPNRASQLKNYLDVTSFSYVNQVLGENLFISTGSESMETILTGIEYWYNEYANFAFGTIDGTGVCTSGQQCGHYTQLVWANTRYVGCGYTKCATVKNLPTFTNAIIFACDYYFAGNYVDDYPYVEGGSCSNCPEDRQTCEDGLCTGCPSTSWDTYCCEYCSSSTCTTAIDNGLCDSPSTCTDGITTVTQSLTSSPTTQSPTTPSPTTQSPTTRSPTTHSPTTHSPTTHSPTTHSPTTHSPSTHTPTTHSPTASTKHPSTTSSPTTSRSPTATPVAFHSISESVTVSRPTAAPTSSTSTNNGCCMSYNSHDSSHCRDLSSTDCLVTEGCYWDVTC